MYPLSYLFPYLLTAPSQHWGTEQPTTTGLEGSDGGWPAAEVGAVMGAAPLGQLLWGAYLWWLLITAVLTAPDSAPNSSRYSSSPGLELPSVLQRRSQAEQEEQPEVVGRCLRSMARGAAALQAALTLASALLTALLLLGRALG